MSGFSAQGHNDLQSSTNGETGDDGDRVNERKRDIVVLIMRYLFDCGYERSYNELCAEAGFSLSQIDVADNVDLWTIVRDFVDFHHQKFNRHPKLVRQVYADNYTSSSSVHGVGCVENVENVVSADGAPTPSSPQLNSTDQSSRPVLHLMQQLSLPCQVVPSHQTSSATTSLNGMHGSATAISQSSSGFAELQAAHTATHPVPSLGHPNHGHPSSASHAALLGTSSNALLSSVLNGSQSNNNFPSSLTEHLHQSQAHVAAAAAATSLHIHPNSTPSPAGTLAFNNLAMTPQAMKRSNKCNHGHSLSISHGHGHLHSHGHPLSRHGSSDAILDAASIFLAQTTKIGENGVLTQGEFVSTLLESPEAVPANLFSFNKPKKTNSKRRSDKLLLTEDQEDALYALVGCADVGWLIKNLSPETRALLETRFFLDKDKVQLFFKNRAQKTKKQRIDFGEDGVGHGGHDETQYLTAHDVLVGRHTPQSVLSLLASN